MRVLIYTHEFPPFQGGLATSSFKLARGMGGHGMEVVVLAPGYGAFDAEVDSTLPVRVERVPLLGRRWVKKAPLLQYALGWLWFRSALRRYRPDAVLFITEEAEVVGGLGPSFPYAPVARVAGSGVTSILLGHKPTKRPLAWPLRRLYRSAAAIVAVSDSTRGLLAAAGIGGERVHVIRNGVEPAFIDTPPDEPAIRSLRASLGMEGGDTVLVTVARVLPRKGQDMVIKALAELAPGHPGLRYVVVGEGGYTQEFEGLARTLGVADRVVFTGGVPHARTIDYYDMADVFIMPNRLWRGKVEGLPNAVIEAGARGKPCIVGRHAGSVEAVVDGVTGICVDPESVEDIAGAIERLLASPGLAREMGESARRMVCERFTEQGMVDEYASLLNSVVPRDTPPGKSRR